MKTLYTCISFVPFAWFLSFLTILAVATFKLGYVPKCGNPIDPYLLGLDLLSLIHLLLLCATFFAVFLWPFITIETINVSGFRAFHENRFQILFFAIGVGGCLIVRTAFGPYIAWVLD